MEKTTPNFLILIGTISDTYALCKWTTNDNILLYAICITWFNFLPDALSHGLLKVKKIKYKLMILSEIYYLCKLYNILKLSYIYHHHHHPWAAEQAITRSSASVAFSSADIPTP